MLCLPEYDESEVLTGVGPGIPPLSHCLVGCCDRALRLQIRTRYGGAYAQKCAAYQNPETDAYHTELTTVTIRKAYDSAPTPDMLVRSCEETVFEYAGPAALVSWGGTEEVPDCAGEPADTTYDPENCLETLLDPPADYSITETPTLTYGGASTTEDAVKAEAVEAFEWGAWSDWTDILTVDAYRGSEAGGYLSFYLAGATRGLEGPPLLASVGQYESELRSVGGFLLHLVIGQGTGLLADMPLTRVTLVPGIPQLFSSTMPTWAEDWQSLDKVLRCVCPMKFAPES
jgi:hypothetical protein